MPTRYDDYIQFHNPTEKTFVGRWEREDYIIQSAATVSLPAWLARHFAKRLCDQVMIKKYGEPLKTEHKKRKEFMAQCLPGVKLESMDGEKPKTTKEQIESDRNYLYANRDDKIKRLQEQLNELQGESDGSGESEKPPAGLQDNHDPAADDDDDEDNVTESLNVSSEFRGKEELLTDNEEPVDDEEPIDEDEDEPPTAEERETQAAKAVKKDSEKHLKAYEEGKLKNVKNPTGSKQKAVKGNKDKPETPVFEGDVSKADSKIHSSLEQDLALNADE